MAIDALAIRVNPRCAEEITGSTGRSNALAAMLVSQWQQLRRPFLEPQFGFHGFQMKRWKPQMTKTEAYRALAERLRAYAQKPEAADYVAEFKQLAKCYRLLAESAERKAQFDAPRNDPPLSKRRPH